MNVFLNNSRYKQLLINSWISSFGDNIFFLAVISYVSQYRFTSLAILLITISETIPLVFQLFIGILGDFQSNRIQKWYFISALKVLLYLGLTVCLIFFKFSLALVVLICVVNLISDTLSYFSSSMVNAIFIKVIQDDLNSAMGFRTSTMRIVRILSNLVGAVLVIHLSIEAISMINTLTFMFALLGLYKIKDALCDIEENLELKEKKITIREYGNHLFQSLKIVSTMKRLVVILGLTASVTAVINIIPRLTTIMLVEGQMNDFRIEQFVAMLSIIISLGAILGSMVSGLAKNVRLDTLILFCEGMILFLLMGIFFTNIVAIVITSFLVSIIVGLLIPRLQSSILGEIPDDKMGTIGSALSFFDVVLPGILSLLVISISSLLNVKTSIILLVLLLISCFGSSHFYLYTKRNILRL